MNHRHSLFTRLGKIAASLCLLLFLLMGVFSDPVTVRATDLSPITATELSAAKALQACLRTGRVTTTCPSEGIIESIRVVRENVQGPALKVALLQATFNLMEFFANRVAYEAAVTIATGGEGEAPLFDAEEPLEAWKSLGLDVAGEALGSINEISASEIGIEFNLCSPGDLLDLALALGIKQKYQPRAPKCDILEVGKNWEAFGANIYQTYLDPEGRQEAMLSKFAETLKPGQNELTASLRINVAIDQKIHEQKLLGFLQRVDRQGGLNSVTDFITGNVTTPADIVGESAQQALIHNPAALDEIKFTEMLRSAELFKSVGISAASTFTNTLLAQVFNRIYTGLFDVDIPDTIDLEAFGSAAGGDRRSAEQRFASLLATSPIRSTEYDALSEFVVCPAEGVTNRGLYNCVMDVNFMAAVTRGGTGVALTVQEAIDEGLLRGDFPLISPQDEASNQDPFCYTYGYCYGNLVKLRQARVIPIGWELAALRNSESNPATLQEIIDGFHDCTEAGTVGPAVDGDTADKWCHLIDPDWILKYPQTDCRAVGTGEIRLSSLSPGRTSSCVDAPSCLSEDNDGNCVGGYGYCVQEENVWRFRGDECPAHYASCLSFENTETGAQGDFLVNTVQYSVCDQDNAGCRWYRTNKYLDDQGTSDPEDDTYEWLPDGETYNVSARDNDYAYQENYGAGSAAPVSRASYSYTSDSGDTYSYDTYAYEDRIYLTHATGDCTDANVGCTQLYEYSDSLYLNMVQNPGFETDSDGDGEPDGWSVRGVVSVSLDETVSATGSQSLKVEVPSSITIPIEQYIDVADENFYSFSVAMQAETSGARGLVRLILLDADGDSINAAGTASAGDCSWSSTTQAYQISETPSATGFETYDCLFTAPAGVEQIRLLMGPTSSTTGAIYYDSVMLEVGETAHQFVEGYNTTPTAAYYKLAPDYLGCDGGEDDPSACDDYAQVCSAQEVGCNLYAPADGDPAVPAIISELDICPSSCVGYTTYKQEATDYESEDFPLYFIADTAASCSEQYVGCDSYTSLADSADGGEDVDYFTDLRLCASEEIADGSEEDRTPSTFFTWEGSDNAGYQLQTWYLLESNTELEEGEFSGSGVIESRPDLAPCTNTVMREVNEVACDDNEDHMNQNVFDNTACDSKEDIFENPDCREFFDGDGNSHFRLYSETVSVSDACTPYRKDNGNQTDCDASGGWWTEAGFCRYYVLPELSTECPSEQNGCRSYTGGTGRNATTILRQTFEGGTYDDFAIADFNAHASSISSFISDAPDTVAISNESVATDGQSLYLEGDASAISGIETIYIENGQAYDEDSPSTCSGTVTDGVCELSTDNTGDGTTNETCEIVDGESECGTLVEDLTAGKTFVLEFWAKGQGDLYVTFEEEGGSATAHDFVGAEADVSRLSDLESIALDGSWQLYNVGPLDTSDDAYADFDASAVLRFAISAGAEVYLDNIVMKQVEENVTVIKDSWVVPSVCDQTPTGVESDQYYLGCEAYTDQNGSEVNLYQFSDLCSESAVGCEGFYHTSNSSSVYTEVHNVRCVYSTDNDFSDEEEVSSRTDCSIDGVTYCAIAPGNAYCTFDSDSAFPQPLPADEPTTGTFFGLVYGPETVVVEGDQSVYIVASDDVACPSGLMGCQEVGLPTYNQDQSLVTGFTSDYVINLPDEYDQILCENGELFCEEWSSTQDGTFYFKDPLNKTCEYKTDITINGQSYFGWFKSGTTEPCYWEDNSRIGPSDNGTSEFTRADGDEAYLINGEEFGIWRNGDEDDGDDDSWDYYQGWVGACEDRYDLCTEFIDVADSGGDLNPDGTSYFVTDDELLSEELLPDTQRCNGLVSQKEGCALFNNTTSGELSYSATVTYVTSMHADVFYGLERDALVDPVSCDVNEGGVFEISAADAAEAGITGTEVNLCQRRCRYAPGAGDSIDTPYAEPISAGIRYVERSCFVDADCPVLTSADGDELAGVCENVTAARALSDDSNEVIKVNRDRSCSAWLACESSRVSWNASTNKYDTICDSVSLCSQGINRGDRTVCTEWDEREPVILDDFEYSSRDVTWGGVEYVGFAIPNQLPVEHYNQANLNPSKACRDSDGTIPLNEYGNEYSCGQNTDCPVNTDDRCSVDSDCTHGAGSYTSTCSSSGFCHYSCSDSLVEPDYRLVYDAGACDSTGGEDGASCQVGYCADDEDQACSANSDCSGGECVVGYCIATADTGCANGNCTCTPSEANTNADGTNTECVGSTGGIVATEYCDPYTYTCVSDLVENADSCVTVADCGGSASRSAFDCVPTDGAIQGQCFNNRCLTDVVDEDGDGVADDVDFNQLRTAQCRSYPEIDSPYSSEVVDRWLAVATATSSGAADAPSTSKLEAGSDTIHKWSVPYDYVSGFQDAQVCAPTSDDGANNDCLCSYDKVSYGGGAETRYYEFGSAINTPPLRGICSEGEYHGFPCSNDADCIDGSDRGRCLVASQVDSLYGWEGYCLERDSSIQIFGSSDQDDQACLSWLPVDQLAGSTDLYGKYTEAGFPLEDVYYCSEVATYYDLWPTGTSFNSDGSVGTPVLACADSEYSGSSCGTGSSSSLDYGDGNACVTNAICPDDYVAILAPCDTNWTSFVDPGFCDDNLTIGYGTGNGSGAQSDDCPYFCVHKDSRFNEIDSGDDESLIGESCVDVLNDCYPGSNQGSNKHGQTVYKVSGLYAGTSACTSIISRSSGGTGDQIFKSCVTRGADAWFDGSDSNPEPISTGSDDLYAREAGYFTDNDDFSHMGIGPITDFGFGKCTSSDAVCAEDADCPGNDAINVCTGSNICAVTGGFCVTSADCTETCEEVVRSSGRGNVMPYNACVEIVQVASADWDEPNKAWTNRIWSQGTYSLNNRDDFSDTYSGTEYEFDYAPTDTPTFAGRALFEETYTMTGSGSSEAWLMEDIDYDSFPLPVLSCNTNTENGIQDGEIAWASGIAIATSDYCSDSGGAEYQYPYDELWVIPGSEDSFLPAEAPDHSWLGLSYEDIDSSTLSYAPLSSPSAAGLINAFGNSTTSNQDSKTKLLGQYFAKTYDVYRYDAEHGSASRSHGGAYVPATVSEVDLTSGEDSRTGVTIDSEGGPNTSFPDADERGPTIVSVGSCVGTQCYEGDEGQLTVNEQTSGFVEGDEEKRVDLSFYVYAQPNQLPLKNIIVDWGDAYTFDSTGPNWPTDSQSGSTATDNFYKNHRGVSATTGSEICGSVTKIWGLTTNTCSSSYVLFSHNYTCSDSRVEQLSSNGRTCQVDSDGNLLNSPCTGGDVTDGSGACVYKPRVHAKDNWGWCTGECDSNPDDDSVGCYGPQECSLDCPSNGHPSGNACADNRGVGTSDPWVYFDGYVIVQP